MQEKWTTAKLALTVVLGAINGAVTTPIALAWVAMNDAFGVIGAALFQPFIIFTSMAAWLIPRPGVFLLGHVISGVANWLTGDPSGGFAAVYWGVAGGIAGEVSGALFGWKAERRTAIVLVAGLLYIPFTNVVTAILYGWDPSDALFWIGAAVALVAVTLESSIPGIALARWLADSGLLRTVGVEMAREG